MTAVKRTSIWLPVEARIEFKMLMLAHNAYHGIGPKYLTELITKTKRSYNLRLVGDFLLNFHKAKKVRCGYRSFEKAAPLLWNRLPVVNVLILLRI